MAVVDISHSNWSGNDVWNLNIKEGKFLLGYFFNLSASHIAQSKFK